VGQLELEAEVARLSRRATAGTAGIFFQDNFHQLGTVLAAGTKDLNGDIDKALIRARGAVMRTAARLFREDIKRPAESGQGAGGRRMTGRFTFGAGKTFESRDVRISDENRGFGFPDWTRADAATQGIWRALEFGLPGTEHSAQSIHFGGLTQFHISKPHRLPQRYEFTTRTPSTAVLRLNTFRDRDVRFGAGFEGKHFIERAWIHTIDSFTREYKQIGLNAFRAFRR